MPDGPLLAVLGGGQLGRMLGLSGIPLGLRFRFLDPSPDAGAAAVGELVVGALDDRAALAAVARDAACVTYEWEGVPADAVEWLRAQGHDVQPGDAALRASQDRLVEKQLFASLDIPTAPFVPVDDRTTLDAALAAIGGPAILKTRRGGYDGKGQVRLDDPSPSVADDAWIQLGGAPCILEGVVPFRRELSIVATRGRDGTTACFPLVENEHRDGILRVTRAPAGAVEPEVAAAATAAATRLLDATCYIGTVCVELFETAQHELRANEFAPRIHNSGHWTIEGATTSQFEQHLRAVLGWPLGAVDPRGFSAMVNCIGRSPDPAAIAAIPGAHLHRYGKSARRGRKLGHVTVTASSTDARDDALARVLAVTEDDG
jgi:5-(carboxyamino)imidazole ribonucleotide synthase